MDPQDSPQPERRTPCDKHPELSLDPDTPGGAGAQLHLRADAVGLVLIGGAAGTLLRHVLATATPTHAGRWPWGTFIANVLGTLVLGVLLESLARLGADDGWRQRARVLIGTGFCGGLTTYSTFAVEADLLVREHATGLALAYLAVSLLAGLLAAVAGIAVATRWHGRRRTADGTRP